MSKKVQVRRQDFKYRIERKKVVFEQAVLEEHHKIRMGLLTFLRSTKWSALIVMPLTYFVLVPLILLDCTVTIFQKICFPIWRMKTVCRGDYFRIDRRHLAYLNGVQKLNCEYCGYANGLIAYVRDVAGQTEQYWCPIKHAMRLKSPHDHYRSFLDYGDAEGFRDRFDELRGQLEETQGP